MKNLMMDRKQFDVSLKINFYLLTRSTPSMVVIMFKGKNKKLL